MSVTFLDKEFESQMKNRILPLMRINLEEGYFKADDGAKIHYGYINNPNAKEAVVISHGFCEFIPKYYELISFYIPFRKYNSRMHHMPV